MLFCKLKFKPGNLMNCKQYKSVPIGRIVVDDEADGSDHVHQATEGQGHSIPVLST